MNAQLFDDWIGESELESIRAWRIYEASLNVGCSLTCWAGRTKARKSLMYGRSIRIPSPGKRPKHPILHPSRHHAWDA